MPAVNPGEIWIVDFGIAAKVRPALVLTGSRERTPKPPVVHGLSIFPGSGSTRCHWNQIFNKRFAVESPDGQMSGE